MSIVHTGAQSFSEDDYFQLVKTIQRKISFATGDIELRKAKLYWTIGRHLNSHVLKHKSRADYGARLFERLSKDLGIAKNTLHLLVRFHREFDKPTTAQNLNWSGYRALLGIKSTRARRHILQTAQTRKLSTRAIEKQARQFIEGPLTPAAMGKPFTYRLLESANAPDGDGYRSVDCGFHVTRRVAVEANVTTLPAGGIVVSRQSEGDFVLSATTRSADDLYTYAVTLVRVIDGDTLFVELDLGFRTYLSQSLRLRGIDAPARSTPEGARAKVYLEELLGQGAKLLITTRRRDKYDRYLADVFFKDSATYINQKLIDENHAILYK